MNKTFTFRYVPTIPLKRMSEEMLEVAKTSTDSNFSFINLANIDYHIKEN